MRVSIVILIMQVIFASAAMSQPKPHLLTPVPIQQVTIEDEFWSPKLKIIREVTIDDVFTKFEKDRGGAFNTFDRVRDGKLGKHVEYPWLDGLVYETIRAAADILAANYDAALDKRLDGYITHIAAAQTNDPDGYINTWTQLMAPDHRWGENGGELRGQHDVYNAGCLVEAAVHHYRATGKTNLLKIAVKFANHMCDIMGPPPKKNIVPAHSGPEEAFIKLYLLFRDHPDLKNKLSLPVDEKRYQKLTEFWIENRGNHCGGPDWEKLGHHESVQFIRNQLYGDSRPSWGSYAQDHKPVLQQETPEGHAVRATLMCTGLTAAARVNGREDYYHAAMRLWDNMVNKRMHIIGGVGAVHEDERFGPDYFLPNDAYLETCAAVGAGFFHHNMNMAFADGKYADELERVLYNNVLAGLSLEGNTYFYVNPLERFEFKRWGWHACPCCPPMFLKMMGALPSYIYAYDKEGIYINLFIGSTGNATMKNTGVKLTQRPRYPWDGNIKINVDPEKSAAFDINIRIPGWAVGKENPGDLYYQIVKDAQKVILKVNGKVIAKPSILRGYASLHREWNKGDVIELTIPMPIRRIKANPKVQADVDLVTMMRGPIVYCSESVDNDGSVRNLFVPKDASFNAEYRKDLLGGVGVITGSVKASYQAEPNIRDANFVAIPYYANANRDTKEMLVWLPEKPELAIPFPSPTIASRSVVSVSFTNRGDFSHPPLKLMWHWDMGETPTALNDQIEPKHSADFGVPRHTWWGWEHKSSEEWAQYDFAEPVQVKTVEVYWWDGSRINRGRCRVPQSWRLLYKDQQDWKPVEGVSEYGTKPDQYNKVTFEPVETDALRIEVQFQPNYSGGILEWRVK